MKPLSVVHFWQFSPSIENFQVAMIRKEPMPLFAGRLANHAELDHVLQRLRHSGGRERELFGCCGDREVQIGLADRVSIRVDAVLRALQREIGHFSWTSYESGTVATLFLSRTPERTERVSEQIRRALTAYLEKNSGRQRFAG